MKLWAVIGTILISLAYAEGFLVAGNCPPGQAPIACTDGEPPNCFCSGIPPAVPKPLPPVDFLKCQDAGRSASFAAARAACSTLKRKCPARPPTLSRFAASGAALSADGSFGIPEQIRRLIEKAIAEACRGIAESTCRNNAASQVQDSDCEKILSSGPAVSVAGCRSKADAKSIFDGAVNELCQGK
ncbi:hypothetical protein BSKO_12294 [Bryopsis sp. KO-2023]|nr:hypothetical protein BSKO_12294 [Bryopsis sp. KO-2023]